MTQCGSRSTAGGKTPVDKTAGALHPYGKWGHEDFADTLLLTALRRDIGKER